MEDKKNASRFNAQEDGLQIDLSVLVRDFFRSFGKLWWLTILLAVIVSAAALLYSIRSYQPLYRAETTFTVETYTIPPKAAIHFSMTAARQHRWH